MKTLVKADRLIDGSGGQPLSNAAVLVEAGEITGVFEGAVPDGAAADADILDFPGCTIMPGLIDTHVHLNLPGDGTSLEDAVREPEGVLVATSAFTAARALAAGITTVRDLGAKGPGIIALRQAIEEGLFPGPRIQAAGQPGQPRGGPGQLVR